MTSTIRQQLWISSDSCYRLKVAAAVEGVTMKALAEIILDGWITEWSANHPGALPSD